MCRAILPFFAHAPVALPAASMRRQECQKKTGPTMSPHPDTLASSQDDAGDSHAAAAGSRGFDGASQLLRSGARRLHVLAGSLVLAVVLLAITATGYAVTVRDAQPQPVPWVAARPVIASDFPDPDILVGDGVFYAYATNASGKHVQVARSSDLKHWTMLQDALPTLPKWADATGDWVWAPEVIQIGSRYVMYYTARDAASGRQCVGAATSDSPEGPFRDGRAAPFVCQVSLGGTIDASPFRDGDSLYLYFKSDGNCCRLAARLWGQRLAPDGLSLIGEPVALLTNDKPWEGNVIEAPNMLKHGASYYLFYSANDYASARYATGYARCSTPLGPCVKAADSPLLASARVSAGAFAGPGGEAFFQAEGVTFVAFHEWGVTPGGTLNGSRYLFIGRVGWHGSAPVIYASPQT